MSLDWFFRENRSRKPIDFPIKKVGAKTSRLVRGSLRQLDAGHLRPKIQLAVLLMLEHEAAAFFWGMGQNLLLPYGSVSKPCTPGEHQNSW
jgi:hypothetical protein